MGNENTTMNTIRKYEVNGSEVSLSPAMVNKFMASDSAELTEKEAVNFVNLCLYNHLNPWVGDAYPVKYKNSRTGKFECSLIVSKQAYMKQAEKNPNWDGFEAGLIVETKAGDVIDRVGSFHLRDDKILGGWCKVYRKDFRAPVESRVMLSEYDKGRSTWKTMKATMIRKVPMAQAHRDAFPAEYQNMYLAEELGHNELDIKPVTGEVIRDEETRTKDTDTELMTGQIIKTAGITGDQIKGIEDVTTESNTANKELSFYLKAKELPEMTSLNNTEADEVIELLQKFKKEPEAMEVEVVEIPLEIKTQLYEAMADMGLKDKECKQFFDWAVDEHNVDPEILLTDFTEWFDKFELEFNKPGVPEGELSHDDFINGINE